MPIGTASMLKYGRILGTFALLEEEKRLRREGTTLPIGTLHPVPPECLRKDPLPHIILLADRRMSTPAQTVLLKADIVRPFDIFAPGLKRQGILNVARDLGRGFVTEDRVFGDYSRYSLEGSPGIMVLPYLPSEAVTQAAFHYFTKILPPYMREPGTVARFHNDGTYHLVRPWPLDGKRAQTITYGKYMPA